VKVRHAYKSYDRILVSNYKEQLTWTMLPPCAKLHVSQTTPNRTKSKNKNFFAGCLLRPTLLLIWPKERELTCWVFWLNVAKCSMQLLLAWPKGSEAAALRWRCHLPVDVSCAYMEHTWACPCQNRSFKTTRKLKEGIPRIA